MPSRPSTLLVGTGLLVFAMGLGVGFALGAMAQTIGPRTPLYAVISVLLVAFAVGLLLTLHRFMESYRRMLRSLQDPARGALDSGAVQQSGRESLAGTVELVRALQQFEEQMAALQRAAGGEPAVAAQRPTADLVTPPESIQNKDAL